MKPELVEGILESLCDAWRETLGRRQQRDMGRVLGDSLGALLSTMMEGSAKAMRVCNLYSETKRPRSAGVTGNRWRARSLSLSSRIGPWMAAHHEMAREGDGEEWMRFAATPLDMEDPVVHEHELLCMTLELSGCYDQLDLSTLATRVRSSLWRFHRTGALVATSLGRRVAV